MEWRHRAPLSISASAPLAIEPAQRAVDREPQSQLIAHIAPSTDAVARLRASRPAGNFYTVPPQRPESCTLAHSRVRALAHLACVHQRDRRHSFPDALTAPPHNNEGSQRRQSPGTAGLRVRQTTSRRGFADVGSSRSRHRACRNSRFTFASLAAHARRIRRDTSHAYIERPPSLDLVALTLLARTPSLGWRRHKGSASSGNSRQRGDGSGAGGEGRVGTDHHRSGRRPLRGAECAR